jgi:hypothetical protein
MFHSFSGHGSQLKKSLLIEKIPTSKTVFMRKTFSKQHIEILQGIEDFLLSILQG